MRVFNFTVTLCISFMCIASRLNTIITSVILFPVIIGRDSTRQMEVVNFTDSRLEAVGGASPGGLEGYEGIINLWLEEAVA